MPGAAAPEPEPEPEERPLGWQERDAYGIPDPSPEEAE
eukprot:COSAG04_NODE_14152_length_578_cov_4.050104_2_plen_37_part_01